VTHSEQLKIFERGIDLFNEGRFFECHEAWEEIWLRADGTEKLFLQGMIQAAVAILHAQRGNLEGARRQYAKSCTKLDSMPVGHRGIALAYLRDDLRKFFATVLSGASVPAPPKINRVG
jgi:predicted metal-dependent hydrolase